MTAMTQTDGGVSLRPVTDDDADLLFDWLNRPETLATKLRTRGPVTWETHTAWLAAQLSSPESLLRIVQVRGGPIGQVRLECRGDLLEVDVYIAPEARRRGAARKALLAAMGEAADHWPDGVLAARVLPGNAASFALFRSCGFTMAAEQPDHVLLTRPTRGR